jgi:hypothetical protein
MTTEAQKRAQQKYMQSAKGRAAKRRAQNRYNHSARGRAARSLYLKSCKGREAVEDSRRRQMQGAIRAARCPASSRTATSRRRKGLQTG